MSSTPQPVAAGPSGSKGLLRADAKTFSPMGMIAPFIPPPPEVIRSKAPCRFFAKGICRNGSNCRFSHDLDVLEASKSDTNSIAEAFSRRASPRAHAGLMAPSFQTPTKAIPQPEAEVFLRNISGCLVKFGNTVEVSSLKLPSDFSTIQILRLPPTTSPSEIHQLLEQAGFQLPITDIRTKFVDSSVMAEVQMEDSTFADKAIQKLSGVTFANAPINVRRLQPGINHGAVANRLQISTVACSWYKASRVAWAHYNSWESAAKAATTFHGRRFLGRELQCKVQPWTVRRPGTVYSVQIGNLPVSTSLESLKWVFRCSSKVIIGQPSWIMPDHEAPDYIKKILESSGALESFEVGTAFHTTRTKAIARFERAEDARKAVRDLDGTKLPQLGKSRLSLTSLIGVKFNVLTDIYEAVRRELDDLKPQIWVEGHVNLKIYAPIESSKKFTTLRLSGGDVKSVAKAKGQVEATLVGCLAVCDGTALWNDFFSTPEGLQFLDELRKAHGVFLYRDLRKRQISLYGPAEGKQTAKEALRLKIEALSAQTHVVHLNSELMSNALHGGFRSIMSILGKSAVRLDVTGKTLTVRGDLVALRAAESILNNTFLDTPASEIPPGDEEDHDRVCSVCYTEPTDPYRTPCKHDYCGECFILQIGSAGGPEDFPIRCLGAQGSCGKALELDELRKVLPITEFETLLHAAFVAHVRTRPQEYQYCPTADCDQIYRTSHDGTLFHCPSCLNSTCTTCKVINHEGSTCAEYKDLSSEGTIAFQRWKEKHHVKPCPKCNTPIEKESGCNHMTCAVCQAHICWFCMECFTSGGLVYEHMGRKHDNDYE